MNIYRNFECYDLKGYKSVKVLYNNVIIKNMCVYLHTKRQAIGINLDEEIREKIKF